MTKYPPLITREEIEAVRKGNELNRRVLQNGIRALVSDTHKGNEQSNRTIRKVADKWIN